MKPRRRYVRSPDLQDTDYIVVSISLKPPELWAIDAEVARRKAAGERISRSALLRERALQGAPQTWTQVGQADDDGRELPP